MMNGVLLIIRMGMDDLPIRFFETENDLGNWLQFGQQTFEEEIEQAANRLGCVSSHALRAEAIHFVDGTPVKIVHVMNFLPE